MPATSGFASSLALDIYPPRPSPETAGPPLAVLLLQGVGIDKAEYAGIAAELSRHRLWVVVPNCIPAGRDYVCPEGSSVAGALASPETARSGDLVEALRSGLVLFGHSAGGIAAFEALRARSPKLPTKPVAIATYGSNAPFDPDVDPPLPPVLMLSGQKDAVVPPEVTRSAFRKLPSSSKTFVELAGLNHYSINDSEQPAGAPRERNGADLPNAVAIRFVARAIRSFLASIGSGEDWIKRLDDDAGTVRCVETA